MPVNAEVAGREPADLSEPSLESRETSFNMDQNPCYDSGTKTISIEVQPPPVPNADNAMEYFLISAISTNIGGYPWSLADEVATCEVKYEYGTFSGINCGLFNGFDSLTFDADSDSLSIYDDSCAMTGTYLLPIWTVTSGAPTPTATPTPTTGGGACVTDSECPSNATCDGNVCTVHDCSVECGSVDPFFPDSIYGCGTCTTCFTEIAAGSQYIYSCPDGMRFDTGTGICDYESNISFCSIPTTTP